MILPRTFHRRQAAFTMIEIAMALAIVGFALVAIIGVLPQGVNVQRDNRRETIINQDANFYIDALRGGAQRLDDLTNYVTSITNHWVEFDTNAVEVARGVDSYTNYPVDLLPLNNSGCEVTSVTKFNPFDSVQLRPISDFRITNGLRILGVLGTPRYFRIPNGNGRYLSNTVVAYARALSGAANEKNPQTNDFLRELAFGYRFTMQIAQHSSEATNWNNGSFNGQFDSMRFSAAEKALRTNLHAHLYDVRMYFRWPLLPNGDIGNGEKKYRFTVASTVDPVADKTLGLMPLYYFQPQLLKPANEIK
jgi:type II secretory pathway pseudopilin PulG